MSRVQQNIDKARILQTNPFFPGFPEMRTRKPVNECTGDVTRTYADPTFGLNALSEYLRAQNPGPNLSFRCLPRNFRPRSRKPLDFLELPSVHCGYWPEILGSVPSNRHVEGILRVFSYPFWLG